MEQQPEILTIGHSTRSIDELLALLREHGVELLVDVRRHPGSRRHPQFHSEALANSLREAGIEYLHEPDLGGRRSALANSVNLAWRDASFRGYADHMTTAEFQAALAKLIELGGRQRLVVLCAEAVPWRCHRQLIADALVARGLEVRHILGPGQSRPHALHEAAIVLPDLRVEYPASTESAVPTQLSIDLPEATREAPARARRRRS